MKYKYVIFDCDGTLADVLQGNRRAIWQVIDHYMQMDNCKYLADLVSMHNQSIQRYFESLYEYLEGAFRPVGDLEGAVKLWKEIYYGQCDRELSLFGDVPRVLHELKAGGANLFVAANREQQSTLNILKNVIPYFTEVVTNKGSGLLPKPDPAMLNYLIKKYSLAPDQTVIIGDTKNDEIAASEANIHFIKVATGWPGKPDYYDATTPKNLIEAIKQIIA